MKAWLRKTVTDFKLALRDRETLFFAYLLPIFFLFLFGGIFARGHPKAVAKLLPGLLCISAMSAGLFGLSIGLVTARERGILRRYRLTPISPWTLISSEMVSIFIIVHTSLLLQIGLAMAVYRFRVAGNPGALFVMLSVGALAFLAIGYVIAAVADNVKTAQVLGNILFFPLMFLGGAAIPREFLPPALQKIAGMLPSGYLIDGLDGIINKGTGLAAAAGPLLVLSLTAVVALAVAAKLFRWESGEPLSAEKRAWVGAILLVFVAAAFWARR